MTDLTKIPYSFGILLFLIWFCLAKICCTDVFHIERKYPLSPPLLTERVAIAFAHTRARLPDGQAAPIPTLWRISEINEDEDDSGQTNSFLLKTGFVPPKPPPKIVLEDGGGGSNRAAAAVSLLTALLSGGPGAIAVIVPTLADLNARVAAHASTFSADSFFINANLSTPSPLELVHVLLPLLHWPKPWDSDFTRCCIADVGLRDASRALSSITFVPGGIILHSRGGTPLNTDETSFDAVGHSLNPVSDKLSSHSYGTLYEEVLAPVRARAKDSRIPVRLLEIGLGCGMGYGEGAGPLLWRAYFGSTLELTILEFQEECALAWGAREPNKRTEVYTGDQRDAALLRRIIEERGPFDVVVDDGGHCQACQTATADIFPSALAPGGVVVIEDLFSSMTPAYNWDAPPATLGVIADLADSLLARDLRYDDATRVRVATRAGARPAAIANAGLLERIVCEAEICAFVRAL